MAFDTDVDRPEVDAVDRRLLHLLNENARRTDAELAAELGVDEGEIEERIDRLQAEGVITKFTAMLDPEKLDYISVAFGFSVAPGEADDIARELEGYENIYKLWMLSGRHNIIAHANFEGIHEFQQFSHDVLHDIDGINNYETSIATRTVLHEGSVLLEE